MSDRPPDAEPAAPAGAPEPTPAPGPTPGPEPTLVASAGRRLVRRTDRKVIAGVASGIAEYLGVEPWVVRVGFIVLTPFGGFGPLAYLIAWLLVPAVGSGESLAAAVTRRPGGLRTYLGVALVLLAVAILASAFSESSVVWAIALIAFGIFLFRQDPDPPGGPPVDRGGRPAGAGLTTAGPTGPPASTGSLAAPASPTGAEPPALTPPPGSLSAPPRPPTWELPPPPPDRAAAWGEPPPRAPRPRPFLGPLTFAAALIVTGLALVLDNLDLVDLTFGQVLAVFLTVLGAGLLVGAWWGRAWGLIPVGLLAVPVVALTALAGPVPLAGGVGERLFQPRTAAEVRPGYHVAGGELLLDLSRVRFGPGAPPIEASVAGGRLLVVVPDEVAVRARGRVGVGSLDLLGTVDTGAQVDSTIIEPAAKPPKQGTAPTVELDLRAGYGIVEVRRASDPRSLHDTGALEQTFPAPTIPAPTTVVEVP
jgi:phage shock protein PspC (stress-responsive transcriptional regulator)